MVPTIYLAICLLPFAVAFAEIITARRQDLARPSQYNAYEIPPPTQQAQDIPLPENDAKLLDIVLVASVDGKFHAMNRTSGQTLWSMSSFSSPKGAPVPSTLAPLVRTIHNDYDPDLVDDDTNQETYIIEPQSGDIYVMPTPDSPLQRFPFSMAELVDMSPFSFTDSEDRRVFVGRKETSLLLVELETGRIKATLNSECPWDPFGDFQDDEEVDLDELDGSKPQVSPTTEVFIGRTDYHISIHTRPLKNSGLPPPPVQNLSFSTYGPNNQDNVLQAAYRRPRDDGYIQGLPNGNIIFFKATGSESQPSGSPPQQQPLWSQRFTSPIVAVFDVLQKPSPHAHGSHTFVLLQPRPGLQELLPSLSMATAGANLPNYQSAYVGMVEETGSLFAMSPLRYPFVAFGGSYTPPKRYIESPPLPTAVDEITRARKEMARERERQRLFNKDGCEAENGEVVTDRRCLIGIRPLVGGDGEGAESRLKRLLNGSPPSPYPQLPAGEDDNDTRSSGVSKGKDDNIRRPDDPIRPSRGWLWDAVIITVLGAFTVWFGLSMIKGHAPTETAKTIGVHEPIQFKTERTQIDEPIVAQSIPSPPPAPIAVESPEVKPVGPPEPAQAAEESDREGEPDPTATPTKKKPARRGGRGGKKKKAANGNAAPPETDDERKGDFVIVDAPSPAPSPALGQTSSTLVVESKPVVATPSLVVSETILGFGSHGTVVFQGSLQGRSVAVKRLLQDFVTLAAREVSILQESDDHPNVIRYYYQEAHSNFLYIALELCPASLADIIESPDKDQWRDVALAFDPKKALRQITSGLRHLHALKLVHRDIKPQNILVSDKGKMLISDFGLCKKLDVDQTSFLPTAHGAMAAGTVGWRAPEILRGEVKLDEIGDDNSLGSSRGSTGTVTGSPTGSAAPTRLTKSVDIFALGCLFYYVLSNGSHPFGDRFEREMNILKNEKSMEALERFGEEGSEAAHLIERMLNPEAYSRPDTTTCLVHPFFWDPGRRLNFLQDASDRFEVMCRDPRDLDLVALEKDAASVVGNDWQARLDKIFIENLGKFRKYDGRSVQDLLRALRNKKHHYQDLPDNVKRHLGSMPDGYLSYFTRRYPRLVMHVHRVVGETSLRTESMFRTYYELAD